MAKIPMHKIATAEVVAWEGGEWGVRFVFDDGKEERCYSGNRLTAVWDAHRQIGKEFPVGVSPHRRARKDTEPRS
jgi:hypothetical protein